MWVGLGTLALSPGVDMLVVTGRFITGTFGFLMPLCPLCLEPSKVYRTMAACPSTSSLASVGQAGKRCPKEPW